MARKYQTVLVTGASSGMGKDYALRLLKEGMTVYAAARSVDKMADLAEAGAIVLAMDISKDADIVAAVERIKTERGGLDVLINNAGFGKYGPVEETPIDAARYQFEVNVFGLARLTQLVLPLMRDQGRGLIINVSSMGGQIYTPLGAWYHATKHAVEAWSDCLRMEVRPFGIDVVILQPGIIKTGFVDGLEQNFDGDISGPYGPMIENSNAATRKADERGTGSPVKVVTDTLLRIIRADKPKTRYAVGATARPLMFLHRYLPTRWYDALILRAIS